MNKLTYSLSLLIDKIWWHDMLFPKCAFERRKIISINMQHWLFYKEALKYFSEMNENEVPEKFKEIVAKAKKEKEKSRLVLKKIEDIKNKYNL